MRDRLPSIYSDRFRLEGLAQGRGTWIDLDMLLLRPLPSQDYLFAWEAPKAVCNAILRLPAGSPVLGEYLKFLRRSPTMLCSPDRSLKHCVGRHWHAFIRPKMGMAAPLPDTGPKLLTHLLRKHGLLGEALPIEAFYPVHPSAEQLAGLQGPLSFGPETIAVHLWRYLYRRTVGTAPPRSGWLAEQAQRLRVNVEA